MKIVETQNQIEEFFQLYQSQTPIMIPVSNTGGDIHPRVDALSFLFVKFYPKGSSWILPKSHNEAIALDDDVFFRLRSKQQKYVLDKKRFMHLVGNLGNLKDINLMRHVQGDKTKIECEFQVDRRFRRLRNSLKYAPIYGLALQASRTASKTFKYLRGGSIRFSGSRYADHDTRLLMPLYKIERAGIHVNPQQFADAYGSDKKKLVNSKNLVHSNYDIYTSTGRPSNAFGGVNYAAINKEDGSRRAFTSRYGKQGKLILFDYDAFHLRLIARLISYQFSSDTNVHTYFGKKYFDTKDPLTDKQYKRSKVLSFRYLYGIENADYEFFNKVEGFKDKLWTMYEKYKEIRTPVFNRRIPNISNPSKSKVFNYLLQSFETEVTGIVASKILELTENHDGIDLCLYTYDSFLIDTNRDVEDKLIADIEDRMTLPGLRVKRYSGNNYDQLDWEITFA